MAAPSKNRSQRGTTRIENRKTKNTTRAPRKQAVSQPALQVEAPLEEIPPPPETNQQASAAEERNEMEDVLPKAEKSVKVLRRRRRSGVSKVCCTSSLDLYLFLTYFYVLRLATG